MLCISILCSLSLRFSCHCCCFNFKTVAIRVVDPHPGTHLQLATCTAWYWLFAILFLNVDGDLTSARVAFLMSAQIYHTAYPFRLFADIDHHMTLNPTELAHLQRVTSSGICWNLKNIWDPSDTAASQAKRLLSLFLPLSLLSLITKAVLLVHTFLHHHQSKSLKTSKESTDTTC